MDQPLKIKMQLERSNGLTCCVQFKYEDLPTFCFICGVLGHSERFCDRLFTTPKEQILKPYGLFLKAAPHRRNHTIGDRWLRNDKDASWKPPEQTPADNAEVEVSEKESQHKEQNQGS